MRRSFIFTDRGTMARGKFDREVHIPEIDGGLKGRIRIFKTSSLTLIETVCVRERALSKNHFLPRLHSSSKFHYSSSFVCEQPIGYQDTTVGGR